MSGLFDPALRATSSALEFTILFFAVPRAKVFRTNEPKHALHPRHNLMTGRIRWFIQIDHPRANVGFEIAFQRRASHRDGSKMSGANEQFVVIAEQERPFAGVEDWSHRFWFDGVGVIALLRDCRICSRHRVRGVRL